MKFGRAYTIYVETEAQRSIPKCPYVEFKRFKKLLKKCPRHSASSAAADASGAVVAITSSSASPLEGVKMCENATDITTDLVASANSSSSTEKADVSCPVCDAQFFPDLDRAVAEVVGCFNACAENLLREHMATGIRKYMIRFRRRLAGDSTDMVKVGQTLVSYGCMNSVAVRKILKKYDKIHSSESGRAFKTRLQGRRLELLQSPLLIELGALAVNLMSAQPVPTGLPQLTQGPGSYNCNFDNEKQTITYTLPDGLRLDFDLTCSICLEVVFDPVALTCGHIFCNGCACTTASVSMFDGVTAAKRFKKCPICRQMCEDNSGSNHENGFSEPTVPTMASNTGVFAGAIQMGELHLLVIERCSSYYQERLPAERERRVLDAKIHWEMQTQKFLGL